MEPNRGARPPSGRRLGPRPLPYHLGLASWTWLGWRAGWEPSSAGWPPSMSPANLAPTLDPNQNPDQHPDPRLKLRLPSDLAAALAEVPREAFAAALDAEARRRFARLLDGIISYRRHPQRRDLPEPPAAWAEGTTRLLDYRLSAGDPAAPVLLVVPSLINRAYVLDLTAPTSLLRYCAASGTQPFLVDWGAPGEVERGFSLTDYILRLGRALDALRAVVSAPIILVGYCMGGLLALALAQARAADVKALVCLATPWDFHASGAEKARALGATAASLEPVLAGLGELPVDLIQLLFAGVEPLQLLGKFQRFAGLDPASPQAQLFVTLEDWLNDGVALAAPVARECLAGWYGANTPGRGLWRIGGEAVRPEKLDLPTMVVLPEHDRIVPPASAEALLGHLRRVTTLRPASGHIGMVIGNGARNRLWRPLVEWIGTVAG